MYTYINEYTHTSIYTFRRTDGRDKMDEITLQDF